MRSGSAFHRIVHALRGRERNRPPAKVVQNKNTHLQTASEHPPRPKPVRLLGPTARAPSTSRPRPPRPATSLTVIYDSARRSSCAPPGAREASLGSGSPQAPPEAGLVAATRRSKATPRPRAGRPATSAAGRIRRPQQHGSRPERASPPGSSACARPASSAEAPGTGSTRAGAACLDREPPQGGRAERGFGRSRIP